VVIIFNNPDDSTLTTSFRSTSARLAHIRQVAIVVHAPFLRMMGTMRSAALKNGKRLQRVVLNNARTCRECEKAYRSPGSQGCLLWFHPWAKFMTCRPHEPGGSANSIGNWHHPRIPQKTIEQPDSWGYECLLEHPTFLIPNGSCTSWGGVTRYVLFAYPRGFVVVLALMELSNFFRPAIIHMALVMATILERGSCGLVAEIL